MRRRETSEHGAEPREKLRTSRELYDQIRWDPRLDAASFIIGYETREAGTQEISLPSFDPKGEIPWHRIQYIRQGATTVWDRHARVDLLAGERRAPSPNATVSLDAKPVHRSALAVIPPEGVWPPIEAIRRAHDKHVDRWMPHMNLLYGFLPEAAFSEAARVLTDALHDVAPFAVTFDDLRRFQHRSSATVWLHPRSDPSGALESLQATLEALFPQCNEQSSISASGFTPHLSIAQIRDGNEGESMESLVDEWRRILPIEFQVRSIQLISRRGDEAFVVRRSIPLGAVSDASAASGAPSVERP